MRKLLLGLLVLLYLPLQSIAQESVGFSDPNNIQPLLDYTLPEWGFTNFYLDFSLDGNVNRTHIQRADANSTEGGLSLQLAPVYNRFYESESRQSRYSFRSSVDYSLDASNDYGNNVEDETNYNFQLSTNLSEKIYKNESDVFLTASLRGNFQQAKTEYESSQTNSFLGNWPFARQLETAATIGVGFGRLRNVNPSIRSLRLGERLNALNNGQSMTNQDYFSAADHFTQYSGYQSRYDRPQKYFWGDMDDMISPNLSALNPFDLLYLTDSTVEAIGTRKEGWEVQVSGTLDYSTRYTKNISVTMENELSQETIFQPRISGSWWKNLSLKHQIAFSGQLQSFIWLNSNHNSTYVGDIQAQWLYTITDRILSTTNLALLHRFSGNSGLISLNSGIDYFVENRFSIFTDIFMAHRPLFLNDGDSRSLDLFVNAGLRYYFKRELF